MKQLQSGLLFLLCCSFYTCHSSKGISLQVLENNFQVSFEQYVQYHNKRDVEGLLNLYHKDYRSLSPVHRPDDIRQFIQKNLTNLERNNFEIAARVKDLDVGTTQAFVNMDWQLKTKGTPKQTDPFANVQRLDIWKLDASNNWRIFRTIIYQESAF